MTLHLLVVERRFYQSTCIVRLPPYLLSCVSEIVHHNQTIDYRILTVVTGVIFIAFQGVTRKDAQIKKCETG